MCTIYLSPTMVWSPQTIRTSSTTVVSCDTVYCTLQVSPTTTNTTGYHWAPWPYHDCGYGCGCPFDLNGGCGLSYRLQGPPLICLSIFSLNTPNPDIFYQYHDSSVAWNSASAIVWWKNTWFPNLNFSFLLKGTFLLWETNCERRAWAGKVLPW